MGDIQRGDFSTILSSNHFSNNITDITHKHINSEVTLKQYIFILSKITTYQPK